MLSKLPLHHGLWWVFLACLFDQTSLGKKMCSTLAVLGSTSWLLAVPPRLHLEAKKVRKNAQSCWKLLKNALFLENKCISNSGFKSFIKRQQWATPVLGALALSELLLALLWGHQTYHHWKCHNGPNQKSHVSGPCDKKEISSKLSCWSAGL